MYPTCYQKHRHLTLLAEQRGWLSAICRRIPVHAHHSRLSRRVAMLTDRIPLISATQSSARDPRTAISNGKGIQPAIVNTYLMTNISGVFRISVNSS